MKGRFITAKAIAEFKEHLILEERSAATVEKYIRDVKAFSAYTQNAAITKETVIAYKKHLQENYAVRSVNSMLASINSLFAFWGWHDLRVKSLKLQQQVFCPEEKELTKAEYARLCRTAERKHNERLNLILQTICGTGIRVSELQYITVEAVKQGEAVVNCKAKTRSVFIVKELKQKLLRYAAEQGIKSGMIFVTRTGKPISRTNIWREMKTLCEEANVNPQKVFPHNLRHLFARVFYGIEKDIAKLADILGHSSINTTRIYIISTGTEHQKQLENMRLII
jgi:integrase family protein